MGDMFSQNFRFLAIFGGKLEPKNLKSAKVFIFCAARKVDERSALPVPHAKVVTCIIAEFLNQKVGRHLFAW